MASLHIVEAGSGVELYDDTNVNFTLYAEGGGDVIERRTAYMLYNIKDDSKVAYGVSGSSIESTYIGVSEVSLRSERKRMFERFKPTELHTHRAGNFSIYTKGHRYQKKLTPRPLHDDIFSAMSTS